MLAGQDARRTHGEAICSGGITVVLIVPCRMLLSLLVAVFAVTYSYAAPHGPGGIEHIHYDQQQHATGNNLRVNMNKILVAILPLEDALAGLGLGGGFGGGSSSDYDDFAELTLEDLKPPPPPPSASSEPEVEDAEPTAEVIPAAEVTDVTTKSSAPPVYSGTKAAGGTVTCTKGDVAAGRCRRQRRSVS